MKTAAFLVISALPALLLPTGRGLASEPTKPASEDAILTQAPAVPPPITRRHATNVVVNLEVKEITKRLADGVEYPFWTFGGDVPGNFIRIREGDTVEFHLHNDPNNKMPHNIDLHAVTGPGGGAESSFTAPGHSSQFSFQALNAGLYVYHCATAPVGLHVANGMYGLILVEPKEGLPPVDHEYYLMQGEFYTLGKFGDEGLQAFDMDKAVDEKPTYVVFNGAVGSLMGEHSLTATVGEKIRLYVGNGGPNLTSSFHVIGIIFDTVYQEGGTVPTHNVQTTVIPPGGAAIVEFTARVPGNYTMVDHALFRAFNKGATGRLTVSGPANSIAYSGKQADTLYAGDGKPSVSAGMASAAVILPVTSSPITNPLAPATSQADTPSPTLSANERVQFERGRGVYMQTCFVCHQPNGKGVPGQIPPLAKSDLLMADKAGAIRGVLQGRNGEVTVNGKKYTGIMIPLGQQLKDEQVADVITYVRNNWGNSGDGATPQEVNAIRQSAPRVAGKLAPNPFE